MIPGTDFVFKQLDRHVENGLRRLGGHPGPEPLRELHIELTHRCNLKCVMCHHWEMPFKDPSSVRREMSLEDMRRFVTGSRFLKDVEIVVLSGGEPWLRRDFDDILAFFSSYFQKARVGVLTNFWNTEMVRRRLTAAREKGVKNLWLGSSLDGLEQTHDLIRGQSGAFKGLMDTVRMVRDEFPGVDFSFSFTITPKNYRELWPTYQYVRDLRLWFGAQMVVNHQGEGFQAPESFSWTEEEMDAVEKQIDMILLDICGREDARKKFVEGKDQECLWLWTHLLYWRYLRKYGRKPERFFKSCLAGERYAMFDPEGNLFFCPVNKHRKVGNVLDVPFDKLWRSALARQERGYVVPADATAGSTASPIRFWTASWRRGFTRDGGKAARFHHHPLP